MASLRVLVSLLAVVSVAVASSVCVDQPCAAKNIVADYVILVDSSNAFETDQFAAIKSWLKTWTSALTYSSSFSQVSFYSYGLKVVSSGPLSSNNNAAAVSAAVDKLAQQGTADRRLSDALVAQEAEVTAANGLRANAEKVLVVIAGDSWSGDDIFSSNHLSLAKSKFDAVIVVAVGVQPIENGFLDFRKLAGGDNDVFFAFDVSQLPYAGLFLYRNGCPGAHVDPSTLAPTTFPTPVPSAGCDLKNLDLDVYLVLDTSNVMPADDFAQMRQYVADFVAAFPLGKGQTQFGLVTTYADSQVFYTGINGVINRRALLHTIETLQQEISNGQTLKLSLQAIENAYLKTSKAKRKLVVYVTGNTNFDASPNDYIATLKKTYGLDSVAARWTTKADAATLAGVTGGLRCSIDATDSTTRPSLIGLLEQKICQNSFCRS